MPDIQSPPRERPRSLFEWPQALIKRVQTFLVDLVTICATRTTAWGKEYWLLTLCLTVGALIGFSECAAEWRDSAEHAHAQYWLKVLTGNFDVPVPDLKEELGKREFGYSVAVAMLINASPLLGVVLLLPRYLRMLIPPTDQEQAVKLEELLTLVKGLAISELVDQFGRSEDTQKKIKSAFKNVGEKTGPYIKDVYGENVASQYEQQLHKEVGAH